MGTSDARESTGLRVLLPEIFRLAGAFHMSYIVHVAGDFHPKVFSP